MFLEQLRKVMLIWLIIVVIYLAVRLRPAPIDLGPVQDQFSITVTQPIDK